MGKLQLTSGWLRPARVAWPVAFLAIVHTSAPLAQRQFDAKQVAMLPPYCKYTQHYRDNVPGGGDPGQIARWAGVLGEKNFHHLHHYCYGLENSNRALYFSRTKQERDRELAQSVREFEYVLDRVTPDFVLLPEILTRRGENLLRLGNGPQGVVDLIRAIELKPDHWPPYAALSDHYKALGDFEAAWEWAERGLSAAPGTKALERRLAELDKTKAPDSRSAN
jgi:hypothetical protein